MDRRVLFWFSSENVFPCGGQKGLLHSGGRERKAIIYLTFSFPTFYSGQGCCHPDKPLCKYTQKYASLMPQILGPQCFLIQSSKLMFRIYRHKVLNQEDWHRSFDRQCHYPGGTLSEGGKYVDSHACQSGFKCVSSTATRESSHTQYCQTNTSHVSNTLKTQDWTVSTSTACSLPNASTINTPILPLHSGLVSVSKLIWLFLPCSFPVSVVYFLVPLI